MKPMIAKPCHAWTFDDAMATRNPAYETPQMAALYRIAEEEHERAEAAEAELRRVRNHVQVEGKQVCALLQRQA